MHTCGRFSNPSNSEIRMSSLTPFLWYENDAIGVARYYKSIFGEENVTIEGDDSLDGTPSGSVQIVSLSIFGTKMRLMSAGPHDKFNESISFEISCKDQSEVDKYWGGLTADGGETGNCGWCKDKYGVSWQIVPVQLGQLMSNPDREKANKVMQAMLKMHKLVVADLEAASLE